MSDELKQCPFCKNVFSELTESSVPSINSGGMKKAVFCGACFAEGPPATDDAKAIAAWNHRADEPALQQQGEAVGAVQWLEGLLLDDEGRFIYSASFIIANIRALTHPPKPVVSEWPKGVLNRKTTLEVLTQHNAWRRGGEGVQTDPRMLGLALDAAIDALGVKS